MKTENKKSSKLSDVFGGIFALLMIFGIIGYELRKDYLINNYKKQVKGVIVSYDDSVIKKRLEYRYRVKGKLYFETVGVKRFTDSEKVECIGKPVIVNYSSIKPAYSHVHLLEYQDKKKTVHLMNSF